MTKAERLARELASLMVRYSDEDFSRAEELLASGELFSRQLSATRKASQKRPTKRDIAMALAPQQDPEALPDFLNYETEDERTKLLQFADDFEKRDILKSTDAVRAFGKPLGLDFGQKLPSRAEMRNRFLRRLRDLAPQERNRALAEARRIGSESSLKLWSDLIVKSD